MTSGVLVQSFRKTYREKRIPRFYSGVLHAAFTFTVLQGSALYFFFRVENVKPLEWLMLPVSFLVGNLVEYWLHRLPLHHPYPGMRTAFDIHTGEHHRFYLEHSMDFESMRDLHTVLFPFWAPLFAVVTLSLVGHFLIEPLWSKNAASLFVACAAQYFLMYEVFHFFHHLPGFSEHKIPLFSASRRLHSLHHAPNLMTRYNFNITIPLCDWVFRTLK